MRLVVLGGSGSATPELGEALADWPRGSERRPQLEIVLSGRSAERLELVAGETRRRTASLEGEEVRVVAETDRHAALDGADVVINAVRIGGLAARVFDETFPQARGVPGEETMGPGGFANAMRTVPAVRALWAEVAVRAPDALHVNLTNPSGVVVAAVEREFGLRIFSACDSPVTLCDKIAERLHAPVSEIRRRYVGMNHVGWWVPRDQAELEATADLATGHDPASVIAQGAVGGPYIRYYVHPDRILESQSSAPEVRAQQLQRLESELLRGYAGGASELPRRGAVWYGTAVLPLVDAWTNGSPEVVTVGMRNEGRIEGLPDEVMTEAPIIVDRPRRPRPVDSPALPPLAAEILRQHAAFEVLTVDAVAANATRDDRIRALMANPMVGSYDIAAGLLDDIAAGSPA